MTQPFKSAREVSEYLLQQTGTAFSQNDEDAFIQHFSLPNEIETFEGRKKINTPEDLRKVFRAVKAHYDKTGVTDVVRHCVEAAFIDETTVVATHETRLICGAMITRAPFPVLSVLKFNGTAWQIESSKYAIEDHHAHNKALMSAGTPVDPRRDKAGQHLT